MAEKVFSMEMEENVKTQNKFRVKKVLSRGIIGFQVHLGPKYWFQKIDFCQLDSNLELNEYKR